MFMSYLKRTYTVQSCSSSVRTLHDENVPAASRSNVQIFKPGMRANRFMVISLFLVYTLLYIEWDFSLISFCFSGNSPKSFPSPCYLFTATEVIRTVTSKNVRCCGFLFVFGKREAREGFHALLGYLLFESYTLLLDVPCKNINFCSNIRFITIRFFCLNNFFRIINRSA